MYQVKMIDDYWGNATGAINEFIRDKEVIDIKMNTVTHEENDNLFSRYLIIYKEK